MHPNGGTSRIVDRCQACGCRDLRSTLFIGYMPPVNQMHAIGERPAEQPAYPAEVLVCPDCQLVQLGLVVDPKILFAPDYPYTSGTTRILHDNFDNLAEESAKLLGLKATDLVVDVGSNDGTLLSKFQKRGFKVLGIEPTCAGDLANAAGIPTEMRFFGEATGNETAARHGKARLVTCANCFAHIEDVHGVVRGMLALLDDDGVFINESHYLVSLLDDLQYDTIYHEHLRYYSLTAQKALFERHGLEIIHARPIPSHGGSIRVYAARKGRRAVQPSVARMLAEEAARGPWEAQLVAFRQRVVASKLRLYALLAELKAEGLRIIGIGAPSRASTMITYVGLDADIIEAVGEVPGSRKIDRCMPGTLIPVCDEGKLLSTQPDVALMFSWHIADELIPKLRARGFKGRFLIPLPEPRLV
jgi:ABC-type Fe3+-hydroxamate transport system substrate-binding protein